MRRLVVSLADASWPTLHLVGGALRDAWLDRPLEDFDFVVEGDAVGTAKRLAQHLQARALLLHEDWDVVRLVYRPPEHPGSLFHLDFAPVRGGGILEDLRLRDFTFNAMALRLHPLIPERMEWVDPAGGLEDLEARRVRAVRPEAFDHDPLRLLRAFRMASTLGCRIDPGTLQAIRARAEGILRSAPERIRDELFKILSSGSAVEGLRAIEEVGLLTRIIPELAGLKGMKQGGHHHLDGWDHTLETCRLVEIGFTRDPEETGLEASDRPTLLMAALLHDVGKPATRSLDEAGRVHFYGHAATGRKIASRVMGRLRTSRRDRERVETWVRHHMAPLHLAKAATRGIQGEKAAIRLLRRLGTAAPGLFLLAEADFCASKGPRRTPEDERAFHAEMEILRDLYFRRDAAGLRSSPLLSGKDLIESFDISPGPIVGRLLRLVEEARVEGRVSDRQEALRYARALLREAGR